MNQFTMQSSDVVYNINSAQDTKTYLLGRYYFGTVSLPSSAASLPFLQTHKQYIPPHRSHN